MTVDQVAAAIICVIIILFGFTAFTGAPYLPSKPNDVRKAFKEVYKLGKKDLLLDLGAGDGIILKIASEEFGARAVGIELNPVLALITRFRLRKNKNARVICGNFFKRPFPDDTTVVYMFGESRDLKKFREKIEQEAARLGRPIYLVSYAFALIDLKPIATNDLHHCYKIMPKTEGKSAVKNRTRSSKPAKTKTTAVKTAANKK